jgi:glycosyltransferase involved in cell wall biosynthesis
MTDTPLISVVVPTYNRARTLPRALLSVLNQGYRNLELIVVDDGSKDDTDAVMATFTDPRIRYVKMERNQGASAARNHGLRLAQGDFIAFQDSDDEWLAGKLERQVEAALRAGTADVAVFHIKVVYGRDENRVYGIGRVCCVPEISEPESKRDYIELTHRRNLMSPQTLMFSRSALEKIGPFDTLLKNSVDWDFSLRLVQHVKVIFIEEPLVFTHIQDDSISILKRNMVRSQLRIILKMQRRGNVDPVVLGAHFARIGLGIGRLGKPRLASRLLRRSIQLAPLGGGNWARLAWNGLRRFVPKSATRK